MNTTGIVMQTSNYTCGPAALATVLQNLGFNATEEELAVLAGTDESGTTMYGLIQAAKSKGLNAQGLKLSINNLKKNSIVFLTINGNTHYSVIREITNESVKLADPGLGNIAMTLEEFNNAYSGYAVVIIDPITQETNRTDNNITDVNVHSTQPELLTNEEMQKIKGTYGYFIYVWAKKWVFHWWRWVYSERYYPIIINLKTGIPVVYVKPHWWRQYIPIWVYDWVKVRIFWNKWWLPWNYAGWFNPTPYDYLH